MLAVKLSTRVADGENDSCDDVGVSVGVCVGDSVSFALVVESKLVGVAVSVSFRIVLTGVGVGDCDVVFEYDGSTWLQSIPMYP